MSLTRQYFYWLILRSFFAMRDGTPSRSLTKILINLDFLNDTNYLTLINHTSLSLRFEFITKVLSNVAFL